MSAHLAEMLLDIKFHGKADRFRQTHPFSEDIESAHAILFNPRYDKWRKLKAYRRWVASGQPCLFGKAAAKTNSVFICILEEHEILRMSRWVVKSFRQVQFIVDDLFHGNAREPGIAQYGQ